MIAQELRACVAYVLGGAAVPEDEGDGWRGWLAARGLGMIPIAEPGSFQLAGYWIAAGPRPGGEEGAAVMFGVPPGVVFDPRGGAAPPAVRRGYVVAALDLTAEAAPREPGSGTVEALFVAPAAEAAMVAVASAAASGAGLEGDRYARGAGTFSPGRSSGRALTLVEAEALEAIELPHADARRNVVTRGVRLNALVGRRFFVGDVECHGQRLCEPCAHLQRLTRPGVLRALVHRGGLRADVVGAGTVEVGAPVRVAE